MSDEFNASAAEEFNPITPEEVVVKFPGALVQLTAQRHHGPAFGTPVKISSIGEGGWLFGVSKKDGRLYLYNTVFHGTKLGPLTVYKTTYVWDSSTWQNGPQ